LLERIGIGIPAHQFRDEVTWSLVAAIGLEHLEVSWNLEGSTRSRHEVDLFPRMYRKRTDSGIWPENFRKFFKKIKKVRK
jgi:hypothetical protein